MGLNHVRFIATRNTYMFCVNKYKCLHINQNNTGSTRFDACLKNKPTSKLCFQEINESTVKKIIDGLPSKSSCGHDNISLKITKFLKNLISLPLSIIINQTLNTGIFPDTLKVAKVRPLYKKGDDRSFSNYRPISLLPSFSKIFEKVIYQQTYSYFQTHNLLYSSQYGFRSGHSTELAGLEIVDRIIQELDKNEIPINIYLDLSKAFDTLDHDILLQKLKFYGITGINLDVFKNYLSGRRQYVEFENVNSDIMHIKTGVPQGSVLGPLLFIVYINDIANASNIFKCISYADDTTLTSILSLFGLNNTPHMYDNINTELDKISEWLKINKLSLNVDKTKFMLFHMPQKNIETPIIIIDNTVIECVDSFNFLGIYLDKYMNWKRHTDYIATKISKSIGILNRLKHILPTEIKLMIYNSLILSHINYGILIWGYHSDRLYKLQKKAMRIITVAPYNAHAEPIFKSLNILKISDIFTLFQLKFYHKLINNKLPNYFTNLQFEQNQNIHHYYTRSSMNIHLPKINHSFATRCIRYSLPVILNNSPTYIFNKLFTHSLKGFSVYVKNDFIKNYIFVCTNANCYVCNQ